MNQRILRSLQGTALAASLVAAGAVGATVASASANLAGQTASAVRSEFAVPATPAATVVVAGWEDHAPTPMPSATPRATHHPTATAAPVHHAAATHHPKATAAPVHHAAATHHPKPTPHPTEAPHHGGGDHGGGHE